VLTVAPGGGLGHVVSEDEITAWNVFHGGGDPGVSEFQVVTSEERAATPETQAEHRSPKSEHDDDGLWSHHEETRELPEERDNARNNVAEYGRYRARSDVALDDGPRERPCLRGPQRRRREAVELLRH